MRVVCLAVLAGGRLGGRLPCGLRFRGVRRQVAQAGAVGGHGLLDRGGEVPPEMEPVGDLESLRRCGVGRLGVGGGAVAAYYR